MKRIFIIWNKFAFFVLIFFIIGGYFDKRIALGSLFCMLGPIIVALLGYGRFWCRHLCPRGSLYDHVVSKFSNKKSVPQILKSKGFKIAIILLMFYMFGVGIRKNLGSASGIGMIFYIMITVTTSIGIILSFLFNHRAWCSFCPMGSIASFIAYLKKN